MWMQGRCAGAVVALALVAGVPGCGLFPSEPPAEAVLAGAWAVTTDADSLLTRTVLTFNEDGKLVEIRQEFGGTAVTRTVFGSSTRVVGEQVDVSASSLGIFSVVFGGQFTDSTRAVISGRLTTQISFLGTVIQIDNGAATMARLP